MTINEAILYMTLYRQKLVGSVSDLDKDIEAYDMAIKALKQCGVLQNIRQEITNFVKTYPFIDHKDTYVKEDEVLEIIDKHIKEIEE